MSGLNISFGLTASEDELAAWNRQANSKVAELVDAIRRTQPIINRACVHAGSNPALVAKK